MLLTAYPLGEIGFDGNANPVSIDQAEKGKTYYCPDCRAKLIPVLGEVYKHHFRHERKHVCSDTWTRRGLYDLNEESYDWHKGWQDLFPVNNREVRLSFDNIAHKADILVDETVLELQHSQLSWKDFDMRTDFYLNCDCKVVWLFDYREKFRDDNIEIEGNTIHFNKIPRTFNNLNTLNNDLQLFFQFYDDDDSKCPMIAKIKSVGKLLTDNFEISSWCTKEEFLRGVGVREDGTIPLPNIKKIDKDPLFMELCLKYSLPEFNDQQTRAIQNIDGAKLLLAVPGSGKTETLITRIAYMVLCRNIDAKKILVLSFTNVSAKNAKERLLARFSDERLKEVRVSTINSLCDTIRKAVSPGGRVIDKIETKRILKGIYKNINNEWPEENDVINIASHIDYAKNTMMSIKDVEETDGWYVDNFAAIYKSFEDHLKINHLVTFNDQLSIAYEILKNNPRSLEKLRKDFDYVLIDESQDNSKIQHEIVRLLFSHSNNVFMVGDEDQSIFAFRGAAPQELTAFRDNYYNVRTLKLESNYRSYKEICNVANGFIKQTANRIDKTMRSMRGDGGTVEIIKIKTRHTQYLDLIERIKNVDHSVGIIYRNNETAIPLIDLLEEKGISYRLNKSNRDTFFTSKVLSDVILFFQYAKDTKNTDLFRKVCFKTSIYFDKNAIDHSIYEANKKNTSPLDELINIYTTQYDDMKTYNAKRLRKAFEVIASSSPSAGLKIIKELGYREYARKKYFNSGIMDVIESLAKRKKTIDQFLERVEKLRNCASGNEEALITLSTIHSAKGMEFNEVFILDTIDGILPGRSDRGLSTREKFFQPDQEKRLFYVAMTRARDSLHIYEIGYYNHEYVDLIKQDATVVTESSIIEDESDGEEDAIRAYRSVDFVHLNGMIPVKTQTIITPRPSVNKTLEPIKQPVNESKPKQRILLESEKFELRNAYERLEKIGLSRSITKDELIDELRKAQKAVYMYDTNEANDRFAILARVWFLRYGGRFIDTEYSMR